MRLFQIVTSLVGGCIAVDWPEFYKLVLGQVANVVSINLMPGLNGACLLPPINFFVPLTAQTMGPIVMSLMILVYYFVARPGSHDARGRDEFRHKCYSYFLALSYIVFPGSSLTVFRAFACDSNFDVDPKYGEQASFLKYDYS